MTLPGKKLPVYRLAEGVRIYRTTGEIRFRKGVWNHKEAIIQLSRLSETDVRLFHATCDAWLQEKEADLDFIFRGLGVNHEDGGTVSALLESLKFQQFLHDAKQADAAGAIRALLGGNLTGFEERAGTPRPVFFFGDNAYARSAAKTLAAELGLPLDFIDDETLQGLAEADLTSKTDAVEHERTLAKYGKLLEPYRCVLGVVESPNVSLLRNLNRLLIRAEKPLILGLVDGPFLCALSTLATETGCFECFEQRMLARLEDTQVYHQFVQLTRDGISSGIPWITPQLHILTATVISEGFLYSTLGMMRLAGRIVSVYQPLLEIQVEDLLRVPYCPGCGFISKAQVNELYTSSKRIMADMMAKIEVEN